MPRVCPLGGRLCLSGYQQRPRRPSKEESLSEGWPTGYVGSATPTPSDAVQNEARGSFTREADRWVWAGRRDVAEQHMGCLREGLALGVAVRIVYCCTAARRLQRSN